MIIICKILLTINSTIYELKPAKLEFLMGKVSVFLKPLAVGEIVSNRQLSKVWLPV